MVLLFLFGKKTVLKIRVKNMGLQKKIILPSIALGLATFIMQASESVISVCFNSSLLKYGGDIAVGAMTILTSVMQFCYAAAPGAWTGGAADYQLQLRSKKCGARKKCVLACF